MKQLSLVFISAMALFFISCKKVFGDGPVITETRNIVNFSGVDLRASADVYFRQDPNFKVEVSAQQNILDVLETYISGGKLVIKFKNDVSVRSHEQIRVVVSAPSANSLRVSGSGDITTTGTFVSNSMDMSVSGSGTIHVTDINTNYLDATISGSGNLRVDNGIATEEKLRISGSGDIDLTNVAATTATTTTSGSGSIRLTVSQSLNVTISGSGSVYYKGYPSINTSISGSGKLIHL
jgi:hypothetical protein